MARRMVLFLDAINRRLLKSPFSKQGGTLSPFITGEKLTIDVVPLSEIEDGSNPAYEPDTSFAGDSFKMGLGTLDSLPTEGTHKATYGADVSTSVAFDATSAALATVLNAMPDVTAAGGVTVGGDHLLGYRITWVTAGAKSAFGSDEVNLLPEAIVRYQVVRAGATGIREVVQVTFPPISAALQTLSTPIPVPSMAVSQLVAGVRSTREITEITCVEDTAPVAQRGEFACPAVGGVYERYSITTIADTALSLNGDYFVLPGKDGPVGFWFDLNASATVAPAACIAASSRQVEVTTVVSGDGANTVAYKLAQVIDADPGFEVTDITANVILVKASNLDADGAVAAGTSGFTVTETVAGVETDAYNGKYFYLYALLAVSGEEVEYSFYFSQDGTTNPPAAALLRDSDLTRITYTTTATGQEMAVILAAAIAAKAGISATASGTEVHVRQDFGGIASNINGGDAPLTSVAVTQAGADSTLDGKHFRLYETNGTGGEKSRSLWFNVSGSASPSGSALASDLSTEVTTIQSGDKAHRVAAALALVIDGLDNYSATSHGTKITVESSVGFAFTDATNETSGFTVSVTQQGGTGTDSSEVVEIQFGDQAIGGVFTLGINTANGFQQSGGIAWNVAPSEMVETLAKMTGISEADIQVEGGLGGNIRLSFQGALGSRPISVTVDDSAIVWIQGLRFEFNLNTTSAYALLYGLTSREMVFELEATQGATYVVKLLHEEAVLQNGLLDASSLAPSPLPNLYLQIDGGVAGTAIQELLGLNLTDATVLTLSGGVVTVTQSLHILASQTGTADDVDTISGGEEGDLLLFWADAGDTLTLKHGTGNILCPGSTDLTVTNLTLTLLAHDGTAWRVLGGGGGVADHGALSGLADDDHPQYLRVNGSRAGTGIQELLGLNLTDATTKTLAAGVVTATQSLHIIAAQTGTADDMDTLTMPSGAGDLALLVADAGDTITITHNVGNIKTFNGSPITLTETSIVLCVRIGTTILCIGNQSGGGGSSLPVVDTTALVTDPSDTTKRVRLDAGAVANGQTRAVQAPDGDCRVRDLIHWDVLDTGGAWSPDTYWLGHVPSNFTIEEISAICYSAAGTLTNPQVEILYGGVSGGVVDLAASIGATGRYGKTTAVNSIGQDTLIEVRINDTGAGSAGTPAYGLRVALIGFWNLN